MDNRRPARPGTRGEEDRHEVVRKGFEQLDITKIGKRDSNMSDTDWNNRKRELRFLKDPLELATFVKNELGKGRVTEMLQLTRMASHSMMCIVSWNHIIDHYLANERVNDALKVYNEMKKRAQFPDSYTYTILLRGLSINAHTSGVLSKALSVYHSLSAPNARVEPSIIHTNAALRVCARAMDMDALWGIAGKMPEKGPGAANEVTYITIINAIRQNLLLGAPKGETEEEAAARKDRGIVEGRRMWEDIISRWRNVDLIIDEELVCAMARLLLIGSRPRDWDDVLSLIEQTMDIARLVPRLGTPARQEAGYPRVRAPNTLEQYRVDDDHLTPTKGPMRGDEFLPVTPQGVGAAVFNPLSYAQPGNNTLSVVQEACQKIVANKAAQEYWDLLCDPTTYSIQPDFNNLMMRLRNLRQNRASAAALKLLQEDMVDKGMQPRPGTFRIAMSTCVRDKNNHNSLKTASQILHLMSRVLPDMDSKAVGMYADLALTFPLAKGQDLVDALTNMYPVVKNLRLQLGIGGERFSGRGVGATYLTGAERQDAITCLRKIYALYDRLIFSNLIVEEQKMPFKAESARLSAFIQRVMFKDTGRDSDVVKETLDKEEGEINSDTHLKDEGAKDEDRDQGRGGWRKQMARPEEQRRPWFSGLGAGKSEQGVRGMSRRDPVRFQ
ncbi:pentatricopeptide repeat protein-like protein [Dothidotthia symphoricarpi CBS 119687]|uniref:Pentatricopeptide repeat protein-like protein n=1 Tax=Dothidotthia symphoricarpi CBS 119687 TaxID=1392245 RepID=A0A6A6AQN3_9PLEO|nr:pentatricopeptide repeat protein-like protein [Dothidotthia symphoricarpi CBS 119687]KAF2133325.1 pentatricopeptide repeat protein-like protein [Dothidotthia symphoricarpi CBS 119687]